VFRIRRARFYRIIPQLRKAGHKKRYSVVKIFSDYILPAPVNPAFTHVHRTIHLSLQGHYTKFSALCPLILPLCHCRCGKYPHLIGVSIQERLMKKRAPGSHPVPRRTRRVILRQSEMKGRRVKIL
jgi:hypothetical protein